MNSVCVVSVLTDTEVELAFFMTYCAPDNIPHIPQKSSHRSLEQKLVLLMKVAELLPLCEVKRISPHFFWLRVKNFIYAVFCFLSCPITL